MEKIDFYTTYSNEDKINGIRAKINEIVEWINDHKDQLIDVN